MVDGSHCPSRRGRLRLLLLLLSDTAMLRPTATAEEVLGLLRSLVIQED